MTLNASTTDSAMMAKTVAKFYKDTMWRPDFLTRIYLQYNRKGKPHITHSMRIFWSLYRLKISTSASQRRYRLPFWPKAR